VIDIISIIIPTYNERENIEKLIKRTFRVMKRDKLRFELIVVDDNSPDGTADIVERMKKVKLLKRPKKLGLTSAFLDGFRVSKGDFVGVMDADFTHPPEKIPELVKALEGSDIAIGSRYVYGSKVTWHSLLRKLVSYVAIAIVKMIFNLRVKDPLSGFFFLRREVMENTRIDAKGFKVLVDILVKNKNARVKEVPIVWVERRRGKSKFGVKEVLNYFQTILCLVRSTLW
jgi:dolichol-phosphate mannosyltransferase